MVKSFTDPLAISRRIDFKLKITNVAAGRQTSLMLAKYEKGNRKKWVVYASGINQFGQLGSHKVPTKPRDTAGKEILEQFDEKGMKKWDSENSENEFEDIEEELLQAFRRVNFEKDMGIPPFYRPLSISAGGAHTAVVFGHVDYDATAPPQENIARAAEFPNFVVTMGNNDFGQCGVESKFYDTYNIIDDQEYLDGDQMRDWAPFKTICGESHTFYLSRKIGMKPTRGWRVFASGLNDEGQLGLGHYYPVFTPKVIPKLPPIKQLSSKGDFTLALDIYDQIWGWGSNNDGIFASFTNEVNLCRPYLLSQKSG